MGKMETGKQTTTDPAMSHLSSLFEGLEDVHHETPLKFRNLPNFWENESACSSERSQGKPMCKDQCWIMNKRMPQHM